MKTEVTQTIQAAPDEVWQTISQGGDVHRWFTGAITTCELTGSGEGAERRCTMADGAALEERIIEVDHNQMRFRYAIDKHPLPASDVVATILIAELPDGRTQVTWGADYSVSDDHATVVEETLKGLCGHGIAALETFHQKAA
ncbi:MAG: SRPBCC family protein [Pseudomonadota bacterium]